MAALETSLPPRLMRRYWARAITSSFDTDGAWLQFTLYACRQILSQHRSTLRIVSEVELWSFDTDFPSRYDALLRALDDLDDGARLDELLAADDEADLAWLPSGDRHELLSQLRRARRALGRKWLFDDGLLIDELRCKHERFLERHAVDALEPQLPKLRGFVVMLARTEELAWKYGHALAGLPLGHFDGFYADYVFYRENADPNGTAPAIREAAARLRQVPAAALLARTRLGAAEAVVAHVAQFLSDDVLVVASESELAKERWPRGARVLTTRLAVSERALEPLRDARVFSLCARGTLAPLLAYDRASGASVTAGGASVTASGAGVPWF